MVDTDATSEESIGRPKEWREGRYQQPGKPVDQSVEHSRDVREGEPTEEGAPVTRKDYENLARPSRNR